MRDVVENDIFACVEDQGTFERHVKIPVSYPEFMVPPLLLPAPDSSTRTSPHPLIACLRWCLSRSPIPHYAQSSLRFATAGHTVHVQLCACKGETPFRRSLIWQAAAGSAGTSLTYSCSLNQNLHAGAWRACIPRHMQGDSGTSTCCCREADDRLSTSILSQYSLGCVFELQNCWVCRRGRTGGLCTAGRASTSWSWGHRRRRSRRKNAWCSSSPATSCGTWARCG